MASKEKLIEHAKKCWNDKADESNQWDNLGGDEMVELIAEACISVMDFSVKIEKHLAKESFKNISVIIEPKVLVDAMIEYSKLPKSEVSGGSYDAVVDENVIRVPKILGGPKDPDVLGGPEEMMDIDLDLVKQLDVLDVHIYDEEKRSIANMIATVVSNQQTILDELRKR